jgi:hypothetical protein
LASVNNSPSPVVEFISNKFDLSRLPSNPALFYFNTEAPPCSGAGFSFDIVEYVGGGAFVYSALQAAYYMGFHRVYIVGAGLSLYSRADGVCDVPNRHALDNLYREARTVYEDAGREVYDCTINGACHAFRTRDISEIYRSESL